jgi:hypothetical protein
VDITSNPPSRPARLALFFRTRGVRFWAITISAVSVGALFAGSQIARNWGQAVDWYTGFGQWLGALGSFVAAGAALWIAVSDRRNTVAERERRENQQDADLERQAGLVRVTAEKLGQRRAVGPSFAEAALGIRNRRSDRIFDIEVVKFIHHGEEMDLDIDMVNGFAVFPRRPEHETHFPVKVQLPGIALASDEMLVLYHSSGMPGTPAEYAAVRYTDSVGRRWEVDTEGAVTRL